MADIKKFISLQPNELLDAVHRLKAEGYYLVQMCATKIKGSSVVDLDYSFGKDDLFVDLKQEVSEEQEVPSISEIFYSAFLYENEIHELYGVNIINNKIKNANIAFSTTNYHVFRAGTIDRNQNINIEGIGARTNPTFGLMPLLENLL